MKKAIKTTINNLNEENKALRIAKQEILLNLSELDKRLLQIEGALFELNLLVSQSSTIQDTNSELKSASSIDL